MKKILPILIIFCITAVYSQSNLSTVKSEIDSVLSEKYFEETQMGIEVYDLTINKELYRRNEKLLFNPASNMKILTTAAGLKYLEPTYNFTTAVLYSGKISDGILDGDIYVVGGCDPDFTDTDLDSIAIKIKALGIKKITGNLYGDVSMMDSLFWGDGWMWNDDPSTDAPYMSALQIDADAIGAVIEPGRLGEKAKITLVPATKFFKVDNQTETVPSDSPSTVTMDRDWINRTNTLIFKGNVPDKQIPPSQQDTLQVNVFEPQLYFMSLFKEALDKYGIEAKGKIKFGNASGNLTKICNIEHNIKSVVHNILKISYNLGAEMILRPIAVRYFGKPATAENGIKFVDSLITAAGMNPKDYRIVDGSGLSHYNLITADLIVHVLKYINKERPDLFKLLYNSFPDAGVDGTLRHRMINTPAQNNVHAKTGSLSGVSSLSGYLTSQNGHLIAFSMLVQHYDKSPRIYRDIQDKICEILVKYK